MVPLAECSSWIGFVSFEFQFDKRIEFTYG